MLELMRALRRLLPHSQLDIVGPVEPDMAALLEQVRARDPDLARAMNVRGAIPSELVPDELCRHRYLLHLSKVDAFPLAILEAIAAGTVPVVFALPGTAEIVSRWGGISAAAEQLEPLLRAIAELEASSSAPPIRSAEASAYYSAEEVSRELEEIMVSANG